MSTLQENIVIGVVGVWLLTLVLAAWWYRARRTPPTTPNHARLIAKPGATLDLVDNNGSVVAKVILAQIVFTSGAGTRVAFEDYAKYVDARTYRGGF